MLLSFNESIWLCRCQGRCGERPVGRFIGGARIQKEAFAQGRADKLYAQRHPARRQLSGDHEGRDSGDAEQIDQRPARCEGLLRGVYGRGGGEGHRQQQEIHLERGEEGVDLPRKSLLVEQGGVVGFGRRLLAILVVGQRHGVHFAREGVAFDILPDVAGELVAADGPYRIHHGGIVQQRQADGDALPELFPAAHASV